MDHQTIHNCIRNGLRLDFGIGLLVLSRLGFESFEPRFAEFGD